MIDAMILLYLQFVLARPLPTNFNREEVPILLRPHSKNGLG